jgi:chitodextrinase
MAPKSTAADRANSKTITGLASGTAYTFTVKAADSSGNQSQAATAAATTLSGTIPPPPGDTAAPGNGR